MAKFMVTVKLGSNGAPWVFRDVETGEVGSLTLAGPPQFAQRWLKRLEADREIEVNYE